MGYIIGHYEEYFYDMVESAISNVLNSIVNCVISDEIINLIIERLDYEFKRLKTMDRYLSFKWQFKKLAGGVAVILVDSVMRKGDVCRICYNEDTGYMDIDWVG